MPEIVFVTIPQETVNDESVRILSWKVASGSTVEQDQQLCEVETSKAVMDIEAPEAGVVVYSAAAGDEVPVGSTICQIVPEGLAVSSVAESVAKIAQNDPVGQLAPSEITAAKVEIVESTPVASAPLPPIAKAGIPV